MKPGLGSAVALVQCSPARPWTLAARPRQVHLRRHHRDHEGDHRPQSRVVGVTRHSTKCVIPIPNTKLDGTPQVEPIQAVLARTRPAPPKAATCRRRLHAASTSSSPDAPLSSVDSGKGHSCIREGAGRHRQDRDCGCWDRWPRYCSAALQG